MAAIETEAQTARRARDSKIAFRYRRGDSPAQIAGDMGISASGIRLSLRRSGVDRSARWVDPYVATPAGQPCEYCGSAADPRYPLTLWPCRGCNWASGGFWCGQFMPLKKIQDLRGGESGASRPRRASRVQYLEPHPLTGEPVDVGYPED